MFGLFSGKPANTVPRISNPANVKKELAATEERNSFFGFSTKPKTTPPNSPLTQRSEANANNKRRQALAAFAPALAAAQKKKEAELAKALEEGRSPSPPPMGGRRRKTYKRKRSTKRRGSRRS